MLGEAIFFAFTLIQAGFFIFFGFRHWQFGCLYTRVTSAILAKRPELIPPVTPAEQHLADHGGLPPFRTVLPIILQAFQAHPELFEEGLPARFIEAYENSKKATVILVIGFLSSWALYSLVGVLVH